MFRLLLIPRGGRRGRALLLMVMAIVCLGWAAYSVTQLYRPQTPEHVRLGAGSIVERRYQIAEYLAAIADTEQLDIELVETSSFNDAIARLSAGELDAAFIYLGLKVHECDHIQLLAGLDEAPLHILVRNDLAAGNPSLIDIIRGRRICLGEPGTSDYELVREIMKFLRLNCPTSTTAGDYVEISLSKSQLTRLADEFSTLREEAREARARQLPDVVMIVGSLPSSVAQHLLDTRQYTLVPFPFASPFIMTDAGGEADGLSRLYLQPATIPAATYVGNTPLPTNDCPSIGMHTLLVARHDLPIKTARRLMQAVFDTNFARRIKPLSPPEIATSYDTHPGAAAYLHHKQPLVTGQFFEWISQGLSVFGAFSAGALSLYGYLRRRRIRRPGEYLEEIRAVDSLAVGRLPESNSQKMSAELARELDERLIKLKQQLVQDYCDNRVQGELVLMSILSLLADSRAQLRRSTGQPQAFAGTPPHVPDFSRRVA